MSYKDVSLQVTDAIRAAVVAASEAQVTALTAQTAALNASLLRLVPPTDIKSVGADGHAPAVNTAAVVTYAAPGAGVRNVMGSAAAHFNDVPVGATLLVQSNGVTLFGPAAVTQTGLTVFQFRQPLRGADNQNLVATLSSGGAAVTGSLAVGRWTELVS